MASVAEVSGGSPPVSFKGQDLVTDLGSVTDNIDPVTGMALVTKLASTSVMQQEARRSKEYLAPTPRRSKDKMKFEDGELSTVATLEQSDEPLKSPSRPIRPPRKSCTHSALPLAGAQCGSTSSPMPRASAALESTAL